jgi:hypothetical protein
MRVRWQLGKKLRVAITLAVGLGLPRIARAEPESVHIDYTAPADCPAATAFIGSLRARTTRFRQAAPDEEVRRFRVRVTASELTFSGSLEIHSPDGSTAVRSVDATICEEVANALALVAALAIDPNALTSKPPPATDDPAEPRAEPPTEPRADPDMDPATMRLVRPPSAAPQPAPVPQTLSKPWQWSVGLHGHMTFRLTPSLGYGGDLFVDAEAPPSSALGTALRLGAFFNQSDVELATGGMARFRWAAAAVEGCPVRLSVPSWRFALHPCLALHLGALHGVGRGISDPKQAWNLWSDAGLVLRLRIAATEHLIVEAQGQVMMPFTRTEFWIQHDFTPQQVYSVPSLGAAAGIGAAYRFR